MFGNGAYMYALYDNNDFLINVFDNPKEMAEFLDIQLITLFTYLARQEGCLGVYNVKKIECFEIHNDIFRECDEDFQEIFKKSYSLYHQAKINKINYKQMLIRNREEKEKSL